MANHLGQTSHHKGLDYLSVILLTIFLLILTFYIPIATIETEVLPLKNPDSQLGYFWSNVIWILPALALGIYCKRYAIKIGTPKPFLISITVLPLQGLLLDIIFAHRFFTFPNLDATIGISFPGFSFEYWNFSVPLPIEEAIFYVGGFLYALMTYLFCRDYWLSRYTPETEVQGVNQGPSLTRLPIVKSLSWLIGLSLLGFLAKYLLSQGQSGWVPEYYLFILFLGLGPVFLFSQFVKSRINWQALSMTIAVTVALSVMWEVTMAIPYGWWGYRPEVMIGLFIKPWYQLPIEAVFVWIIVSFNTVFCYEYIEMKFNRFR